MSTTTTHRERSVVQEMVDYALSCERANGMDEDTARRRANALTRDVAAIARALVAACGYDYAHAIQRARALSR